MALTTEMIQLPGDVSRRMDAYLARPAGDGPFPIMLVIMEAFGLNDHMKKVTDQYANEGYAAISPDLYFREEGDRVVSYDNIQVAIQMLLRLTDAQMVGDLNQAIDYLRGQPYANPQKIGTVGYCMGGRASFLMATIRADLGASVSYYGGRIVGGVTPNTPVAPIDLAGRIQAPVLAFWGETDASIPLDQVETVEKRMKDLGKSYQSVVYSGAGHGFNCDERASYETKAAEDAWAKASAFFARHLKG